MNISPFSNFTQPGVGIADKSSGATVAPPVVNEKPVAPVDLPAAVQPTGAVPSLPQLSEAVKNINKTLQTLSPDLEFSIDQDVKRPIIKVIDQKTKEVIRQIPSEDVIEIAKALDKMQGLLIKQQA